MKKVTKRLFEEEEKKDEAVRINKYLSDAGVCSRREADTYIEQGKVLIDGVPAVMGSKVLPGQKVSFGGKVISREEKMVLIAFNKPRGIVCTTDQREPDNIIDFIQYKSRIYPIGRLDKDSEGLILLTNHGDIVNKILRAGNHHEKEYIVRVNKEITMDFLKGMAGGVPILDTVTKPCTVEAMDKFNFRIILRQGLNRQIRRMCEYFGYRVVELQRIRVMNINLGRLKVGDYRNLTDWELEELKIMLQESSNLPVSTEIDEEFMDVRTFEQNNKGKRQGSGKAQNKARNFSSSVKSGENRSFDRKEKRSSFNQSKNDSFKRNDKKNNEKNDEKKKEKINDKKRYEKKSDNNRNYDRAKENTRSYSGKNDGLKTDGFRKSDAGKKPEEKRTPTEWKTSGERRTSVYRKPNDSSRSSINRNSTQSRSQKEYRNGSKKTSN